MKSLGTRDGEGTVHLVLTGGTIGSRSAEGRTDLAQAAPDLLGSLGDEAMLVSVTEPIRILSENADGNTWKTLATHLAGLPLKPRDAILIAHGSDSLSWSAKALSIALRGIDVPVVLFGSQLPLADQRSNGVDNFRTALEFASQESLPGVYVAWRNADGRRLVHLASRVLPCDETDSFVSVRGLHFAEAIESGRFQRNHHPDNPSRSDLGKAADPLRWRESLARIRSGIRYESRVLVLPAMPALDHSAIDPSAWKAMVRLPYHSATAPATDDPTSLLALCRRARSLGVPVFLGPARLPEAPYASLDPLLQAGVLRLPDMETTTAIVKLQWLLGNDLSLESLAEDWVFEHLSPPSADLNFRR